MSSSFFDMMAVHVAKTMDRRQFFRNAARRSFQVATAAAASSSLVGAFSAVAEAASTASYPPHCASPGPGCPAGCGSSRCCSSTDGTRTAPTGCNCGENANCVNNAASGGKCKGRDLRVYSSSNGCWTCKSGEYGCHIDCRCVKVTTCCDCRTRPTTQSGGCDPSLGGGDGQCISWARFTKIKCSDRYASVVLADDVVLATEPVAAGPVEVNVPEAEFDDFGINPGEGGS